MHPFDRRLTKLRTKLIIAGTWASALGITSVLFHVARATRFDWDHHNDNWQCSEVWDPPLNGQVYTVAIFLLTFVFPLIALTFTYASIVCRMWLSTTPGNADINRDRSQLKAKRKVIKMLVTIVALFATCWLPLQVYNLLQNFMDDFNSFYGDYQRRVLATTYFSCHWLAMANSLVNPLVYCFMSDTFRADLRELFNPGFKQSSSFKSQPLDSGRNSSTRTHICLVQRGSSHGSNSGRRYGTSTASNNTREILVHSPTLVPSPPSSLTK